MKRDLTARKSFIIQRKSSLVGEVRDSLERMILRGEVAAGERINEATLAEQFGVSRSPVREAARSLEQQGLVTTVVNRGVFVRKLSLKDALELYDLRSMIAGKLCASVAEHVTPHVTKKLRNFVDRMQQAARNEDEDLYFEINLAFHDFIAEASGAVRARQLYLSMSKEVRLLLLRVLSGAASLELSNAEHNRIVVAIECGDVEAARREGAQHHFNGKSRLIETLGGDYGAECAF